MKRAMFLLGMLACGAPSAPRTPEARRQAVRASHDAETIGAALTEELTLPSGLASEATALRARLGETRGGLLAHFARALYDETHGEPDRAAEHYLAALEAAADGRNELTPLYAWYAAHAFANLTPREGKAGKRTEVRVHRLLEEGTALGFRAMVELAEWHARKEPLARGELGCVRTIRMTGPFEKDDGRLPPENPGPWPPRWELPPGAGGATPREQKTRYDGCIFSAETAQEGLFFAETFFELPSPRELLLTAGGAVSVRVDDVEVLSRSAREWGSYQRFGAHVALDAGRHRVVLRLPGPLGSLRLLTPEGHPLRIATDIEETPYSLVPPRRVSNPNPLEPWIFKRTSEASVGAFLAAELAHIDSMSDVASVLIAPLVSSPRGAGLSYEHAARYAERDPALSEEKRKEGAASFYAKARSHDAGLVLSRAALALEGAENTGLTAAIVPLRSLATEYPNDPAPSLALVALYGRLGFRTERASLLVGLTERFPDNLEVLETAIHILDEDGERERALQCERRLASLSADAELLLERAIARHDFDEALRRIDRLVRLHPERKNLPQRRIQVLSQAGRSREAESALTAHLRAQGSDPIAELRLFDKALASGDPFALQKGILTRATSAPSSQLKNVKDMLDDSSALHPYRVDTLKVIAEFENDERTTGKKTEGVTARVLDYAALFVRPDGTSEMLEHEVQRIQSEEAVAKESEVEPPRGRLLRLRVIKPDGRTFEPMGIAGKPTLTLPHVEVGDYVEMEHIMAMPSEGERRYRSPHWFFREAQKGYWRSEFVTLVPKDKPLVIETRGDVPPPRVKERGLFMERAWRVEKSPPAPEEPASPPITETLPSVRIGWGISLEETVKRLAAALEDKTPRDPRVQGLAENIVRAAPPGRSQAERAYRWVMDHVEEGPEVDPRRVLLGLRGSRQVAFRHLLTHLGIAHDVVFVENKLAAPKSSPLSEVERLDAGLIRIHFPNETLHVTIRDPQTPFGYVPPELRGQPGVLLRPGAPKVVVPEAGVKDGIAYTGRAFVRERGSAELRVTLTFTGGPAIQFRGQLREVAREKLVEFLEKHWVSSTFEGGHLRSAEVRNERELDKPLVLTAVVEVPELVKRQGTTAIVRPLFPLPLAQLASLRQRQLPLLRRAGHYQEVDIEVVFADGYKLPSAVPEDDLRFEGAEIRVHDKVYGQALHLRRTIDLPAARVEPAHYESYRSFADRAHALVGREFLLGVR